MDATVLNSSDDEEHPRNAGAIRTALMLGAVFECNKRGDRLGERWCIVGVEGWWHTKSLPALLFLATHGIEIDKNGSPKKINGAERCTTSEELITSKRRASMQGL